MSTTVSTQDTAATTVERTAEEDALVRQHLPVVQYVVTELAGRIPSYVPRDDLVSAGMLGLAQAARGWDAERGVPFGRFAATRIRGAILDELRSRDWASRSVRADARRISAATDALTARTGATPTDAEIAAEIGFDVDRVRRSHEDVHRATVVNYESIGVEGDVADLMPDSGPTPADALLERERQAYLADAVLALPERLRHVVVGYYFHERPMAELAAELGVTESRISQICAEAVGLMRGALQTHLDRDGQIEDAQGRLARKKAAYYAAVATQSTAATRLSAPVPVTTRAAALASA